MNSRHETGDDVLRARLRSAHARSLRLTKDRLQRYSCTHGLGAAHELEQAGFFACLAFEAVLAHIKSRLGYDWTQVEAASAISQCEAEQLLTKSECQALKEANRCRNHIVHRYTEKAGWTTVLETERVPAVTHLDNAHSQIDAMQRAVETAGLRVLL